MSRIVLNPATRFMQYILIKVENRNHIKIGQSDLIKPNPIDPLKPPTPRHSSRVKSVCRKQRNSSQSRVDLHKHIKKPDRSITADIQSENTRLAPTRGIPGDSATIQSGGFNGLD